LKTLAVSLTEYVFNLGKTLWDEFSGRYYPLVSAFWLQFSNDLYCLKAYFLAVFNQSFTRIPFSIRNARF